MRRTRHGETAPRDRRRSPVAGSRTRRGSRRRSWRHLDAAREPRREPRRRCGGHAHPRVLGARREEVRTRAHDEAHGLADAHAIRDAAAEPEQYRRVTKTIAYEQQRDEEPAERQNQPPTSE